ncbi:unnamed protein product [Rhizophagus irregularis]|uniref:Uncharacterized protein n=1 Tax=Rhizophagus irregularis TaxID=588596 RepID=A0A915ZP39_9GLOM|nr:hypothetical protein RIR_jg36062.t1 [Rhizophagus irregularis DAOM 181602=DAOM 197198]CAB4489146.1 unnamed protein product [Rhizophagus irregularis]CAB5377045.1 unnamed protein product [Rhizophagus irregularis]CAB5381782.1 unnamed protein product [Rhizophagus irregularis]
MSFFMTSVARGRQEQERIRAAAFKFDDKENDGCPRKYHRSRLFAERDSQKLWHLSWQSKMTDSSSLPQLTEGTFFF